jgi:uncharacterized phage protein gp47/JayE
MSYSVPTFRQILSRVQTDLGADADHTTPRASVEYGLARAIAGVSKGLYGAFTWLVAQCFPNTADETYGWRWGSVWGIDQLPATAWQGNILITGAPAASIPANTEWGRADGELYKLAVAAVVGGAGSVVVSISAEKPSAAGNNPDGQILSLTTPLAGVDTDATVQSSTVSGADVEDWKTGGLPRLLARLRNPPKGGGPGDYVAWALEVPGNTRAWEFANLEANNSVSVAFARDNDPITPIPDSGELATTLTHIQSKAPITVEVRVITLIAKPVNLVFTALTPNTLAVQTAIEVSVGDFLLREGAPAGTIALSRLEDAISSAVGEISHVLSSPSADIVCATNELPSLGTRTWPP